VGGKKKTATEGQEGSKSRGRHLHLQRDHKQRGWSLKREALALSVQRVMRVSSTSSGVTHRSGGLADQELWLEETWTRSGWFLLSEEEKGSG